MGRHAFHNGGDDHTRCDWNDCVRSAYLARFIMNKRVLSFWALLAFLFIVSVPMSTASGAPVLLDTLTPQPTETIAPTLTPYLPSMCTATSMIPTSPPFYTPTEIPLPTSTGSITPAPTLTMTNTPMPTATTAPLGAFEIVSMSVACNSPLGGTLCDKGGSITESFYSPMSGSELFWGATVSGTRPNGEYGQGMNVYLTVKNISGSTLTNPNIYFYWQGLVSGTRASGLDTSDALNSTAQTITMESPFLKADVDEDGYFGQNWTTGTDRTYVTRILVNPASWSNGMTYSYRLLMKLTLTGSGTMATPTPIATPLCASTGDVQPSEMVAYFNPPTFSLLGCYMIFQPISLPLPSLSWSPFDLPASVDFPGWQICVQLLTFAAVFANMDWALIAGGFVTLFSVGGIYTVLKNQ